MVNGLFVGIGVAVGAWIATHYFTRHLEKIEKKILNGNGEKEKK
jgi:uncharacterized protein YneF (UPF0154 family)